MTNREQLKALKLKHKLTREEIAELIDVSLHAVHSWLKPPDNKSARSMPNSLLGYLKLKLSPPGYT